MEDFEGNCMVKHSSFQKEPTGYHKTILSDLQGAWSLLRQAVVDNFGLSSADRVLLHIDEAMSWESVRDLRRMPPLVLMIRNICERRNPGAS